MKRKFLSIMSVVLLTSMLAASLTGCGTQAKATNQEIMNEETIVVTDEESLGTRDEMVVSEGTNVNTDVTENDTFVFYPEFIEGFPDEPYTSFEFEEYEDEITVENDTPVHIEGNELGYIKAGSTVKIIEKNTNDNIYRVENNTGIGFEYLYVFKDDLLTMNDMEDFIMSNFIEYLNPTFLDEPLDDMDYVEFNVERMTNSGVWDTIAEALKNDDFSVANYTVFCVVCTESDIISDYTTNPDYPRYLVNCKVYYK